jgi:hypothetical protein
MTFTADSDCDKRQTRPLVREGAPQRQDRDCQTEINILLWAPEGARHQDWLTDWLTDRQSQCDCDCDFDLLQRIRIEGVSGVGSWQNNGKKGIRLCKEDFMCDLKLQWDCYESVAGKRLVESVTDWGH